MAIAYTRISDATDEDILFYDPASDRRAASLDVGWDRYFEVASQEILFSLEFGWWNKYCDLTGASRYTENDAGKMVTAFNPDRLNKADQTLIRLDTFKAIEVFYQSLVTDTANVNDVDKANYEHAKERYLNEWAKATQMMAFYDLDGDGETTKLEENRSADADYMNSDRRYF